MPLQGWVVEVLRELWVHQITLHRLPTIYIFSFNNEICSVSTFLLILVVLEVETFNWWWLKLIFKHFLHNFLLKSKLRLELKLFLNKRFKTFTWLIVKYAHKIVTYCLLESLFIRCRVQNSWSVLTRSKDMLFNFRLQELFKREILDVVNNSYAHKLCGVVNPHQEWVVNFFVTAKEGCVVMDSNLHQPIHTIVHNDWLRVLVLDKVCV